MVLSVVVLNAIIVTVGRLSDKPFSQLQVRALNSVPIANCQGAAATHHIEDVVVLAFEAWRLLLVAYECEHVPLNAQLGLHLHMSQLAIITLAKLASLVMLSVNSVCWLCCQIKLLSAISIMIEGMVQCVKGIQGNSAKQTTIP